eukprot:GHVT01034496.1.p1 GENE.GHVT01034496.1~~GHVT01034496.1.p1  ORF type:complete len:105 (+),score=1.86 GHVT01034496.1:110-424(+)
MYHILHGSPILNDLKPTISFLQIFASNSRRIIFMPFAPPTRVSDSEANYFHIPWALGRIQGAWQLKARGSRGLLRLHFPGHQHARPLRRVWIFNRPWDAVSSKA